MTVDQTGREGVDALSDRVDTIGWGLLFVAVGAVALVPAAPDGAWLIAAGSVILGASVARRALGLPVHGVTLVVGVIALAAGVCAVAGLDGAIGPLTLIVFGAALIIAAASSGRRTRPIARTESVSGHQP